MKVAPGQEWPSPESNTLRQILGTDDSPLEDHRRASYRARGEQLLDDR